MSHATLTSTLSTLRVSKARAARCSTRFTKARAGVHNPETAVTSRIPPRPDPCEIITDIAKKGSGLLSIAVDSKLGTRHGLKKTKLQSTT
jgi:hypothetical protein